MVLERKLKVASLDRETEECGKCKKLATRVRMTYDDGSFFSCLVCHHCKDVHDLTISFK